MTEAELANHAWWLSLWERIETAAYFGVVVALAIEFGAHRLARPHRLALDGAQELRLATAEKETQQLKADNLELEKIVAPRSLTPVQRKTLTDALSQFAGKKVIIASSPMDGEALLLALQIKKCLIDAHIEPVDMISAQPFFRGVVFGVHVAVRDLRPDQSTLLATLVQTFTSVGQQVYAVQDDKRNAAMPSLTYPGGDFPDAEIAAAAIFVGLKPIPEMQ